MKEAALVSRVGTINAERELASCSKEEKQKGFCISILWYEKEALNPKLRVPPQDHFFFLKSFWRANAPACYNIGIFLFPTFSFFSFCTTVLTRIFGRSIYTNPLFCIFQNSIFLSESWRWHWNMKNQDILCSVEYLLFNINATINIILKVSLKHQI